MANKQLKHDKNDEIISRVVLLPQSHWLALGEEGGRSGIIRKLIGDFLKESGALRRMRRRAKAKMN